jgi:hypothetical protein
MTPVKVLAPTEVALALMITVIYPGVASPTMNQEYLVSKNDIQVDYAYPFKAESVLVDSGAKKWERFRMLAEQWRQERGAMSSITQMSTLPSYQKIIGMGDDAVPLILAQLRSEGDEPDQWFWALRIITDADPVRPEDRGNFQAMAKAWLAWSESEDYAGYLAA